MSHDFIQSAAAIVERLRALDTRQVVFGVSRHGYRFNPPLTGEQVSDFEQRYKVSLPAPYRRFITELGNGGAGPYYGIEPLRPDASQLLQPFPGTLLIEFDEDTPEEVWSAEIPGAVVLSEYGCGIFFVLVIRGEAAGEVWVDARYESGISPTVDRQGVRMTFESWWLSEMEAHLARFERILALMKAATPHEEIHNLLEPGVLQLEVDETMLSIMNQNPTGTPKGYANKPWGKQCGLVEDHYGQWLQNDHGE